jgi:hypothetical protein
MLLRRRIVRGGKEEIEAERNASEESKPKWDCSSRAVVSSRKGIPGDGGWSDILPGLRGSHSPKGQRGCTSWNLFFSYEDPRGLGHFIVDAILRLPLNEQRQVLSKVCTSKFL